jgi:hypothetical protein
MPSKSSGRHISASQPTSTVADGHTYTGLKIVARSADIQKLKLEPHTELVPQSVRNLFKVAGPKHCPHCGGPMRQRKAKLSVGENCETREIQLSICSECVS